MRNSAGRLVSALLLAGGLARARADATLPDATPIADDVEVHALPDEGTLRLALDESSFMGCSMSYQSTEAHRTVTLQLRRQQGERAFELRSEGTVRRTSGGRSGVSDHPRAVSDRTTPVAWSARGRVVRRGAALALVGTGSDGVGFEVECAIQALKRAGSEATVDALVCTLPPTDAFTNHPQPTTWGRPEGYRMIPLPFGRVTARHDGWQASLHSRHAAAQIVEVAPAPVVASR